jgi:hypothetical protein
MGLALHFGGIGLDMHTPPTTDDLHQILCRTSRILLDGVKRHPTGTCSTTRRSSCSPSRGVRCGEHDVADVTNHEL